MSPPRVKVCLKVTHELLIVLQIHTLYRLLGKSEPGTLRSFIWPAGVFEIYVVKPLQIHKRDNDLESLKNLHIRFTYRNRWKYCGFVVEASASEIVVRLTNHPREGEVKRFDRRMVSGITWVPCTEKFEFKGWDTEDGDPGKVPFTREVKLNDEDHLKTLNESELYFSMFKNESLQLDLLGQLVAGTNSRGRYARTRLSKYRAEWPDVGVTEADLKDFIRIRFVTDLFGPGDFKEKFSKEWFGHGAQGKLLSNIVFYKFALLNALYRPHTVQTEKAFRWIREHRKYRYTPIWLENFLHDAIRIGNAVKTPSVRQSIDETIEMGSSIYASDIYQWVKGKRHDWGLKIIKSCGSCRELLGKEYEQLSATDRGFVGAGWCHAAMVETGKKYRKRRTYDHFLQGYSVFWVLIYNYFWFIGQGYCFFVDGYFTRNPVALLSLAKKLGINVSGTCRNDARDLPDDRKEMLEIVKDAAEGSFMTCYSSEHQVSFFVNRGRKAFPYLSNYHSTTDIDSLRRRLKEGGNWVERDVDVSLTIGDHNKGGFPNVDAGDGTIAKAGIHHRKSSHWWRVLVDAVIFHIIPLHAWLAWRVLHPEKKTTCRQFLLKIAQIPIEGGTYMRRKSKPKREIVPVALRGRARFTGKPVCELSVSELRAEMGPRQTEAEALAPVRAWTLKERANICMNYLPRPCPRKGSCCYLGCNKRIKFRCHGCGAFGCFQNGQNHLEECHVRMKKARSKMLRFL